MSNFRVRLTVGSFFSKRINTMNFYFADKPH
jgi:hypothetical protein